MPELNGFATGRKKKASEEDELDRSLEGMDISDSQFGKESPSLLPSLLILFSTLPPVNG